MRAHFHQKRTFIPARSGCAGCGILSWCQPARLGLAKTEHFQSLAQHQCTIKRHGFLVHAGDALDLMCVLKTGSLRTGMPDEGGCEQLIGLSLREHIIGMGAIATGQCLSNGIALEDSRFAAYRCLAKAGSN